jgi:glycerol-3-phosphate dehydrogenase
VRTLSRAGGYVLRMYDVLVIGGGITGAGAARDAAMRGLSTLLVEADDLASGTSSRSSKLVHGGLRYLEQGEFHLVFEAVSERRVLMDIAPHLVTPAPFLFPTYKGGRVGFLKLDVGMWLYDGLSLFRSPRLHRALSPRQVALEEPGLLQEGLTGAPLYYDCATDDARLTLENAMDARRLGAEVRTYTRVVGMLHDAGGRIAGVRLRDAFTGAESEVRARVVINATGPWTDRVRGLAGERRALLRPTRGVHLVVDAARLSPHNTLVCFHPRDGRLLFVLPWGDRSYVGTTDTDDAGDPAQVHATADDVAYLLEAANHYFPLASPLTPADVISTWAGLRPLLSGEGSESSVSREHEILVDPDGLITIAGGKLTTFRKMAQQVVEQAVALLRVTGATESLARVGPAPTATTPLPGGVGWPEGAEDEHAAMTARILAAGGEAISPETARLFATTYGARGVGVAERMVRDPSAAEALVPGRPERMAQVDVAVDEEFAQRVGDVLVRRTQIHYRDQDQGLGCGEAVAARMGVRLGWDAARVAAEVEHYRAEVALSRRWRSV